MPVWAALEVPLKTEQMQQPLDRSSVTHHQYGVCDLLSSSTLSLSISSMIFSIFPVPLIVLLYPHNSVGPEGRKAELTARCYGDRLGDT